MTGEGTNGLILVRCNIVDSSIGKTPNFSGFTVSGNDGGTRLVTSLASGDPTEVACARPRVSMVT